MRMMLSTRRWGPRLLVQQQQQQSQRLLRVASLSSCSAAGPVLWRRSALWVPTEKENPADAAIPSHQLLVRGGFIRKSGHGAFALLPLGRRVLDKLERVIDEEMARIGGNKLDLPLLIPAELWAISGRWQTRGPELLAFADRRGAMQTLAPTHEESITSLVAQHYAHSNATLRLYQIGRKFRDEIRPRFGLLRGREFVMKDMYSFDTTFDRALATYEAVAGAYDRILRERLRLPIAKVEADSGNIGGNLSHEFHVLAAIGEDGLLSCSAPTCDYAANVEKAHGTVGHAAPATQEATDSSIHETAAKLQERLASAPSADKWKTVLDVLQSTSSTTTDLGSGLKCRVFVVDESTGDDLNAGPGDIERDARSSSRVALVLVRGDRDVNGLLLKPFFNGDELSAVDDLEDIAKVLTDDERLQVFVDDSLATTNPVVDVVSAHATSRALDVHHGHFRLAQEGDGCPKCHQKQDQHEEHGGGGHLEAKRGIEVGHVFYLGHKYSKPFGVTCPTHDEHGRLVHRTMEMGCFGMGVTRLIAAVVESSHDAQGIVWPEAIAPFRAVVMAIGAKAPEDPAAVAAQAIAQELSRASMPGDVLLDDRWNESPGSKLTEAELLGYPYRIVVGRRFAKDGVVEVLTRATMDKTFLRPDELAGFFAEQAAAL